MALERSEKRRMRLRRVRRRVRGSDALPRLSIYRSLHHIYAQVISDQSGRTLVAASTVGAAAATEAPASRRSVAAAKTVGKSVAQRCLAAGIDRVIFDRGGFLYHGRVRALAEAAREAGLKF